MKTPLVPSYIEFGQLNITGNQITVEASINGTTPWKNPSIKNQELSANRNKLISFPSSIKFSC